MCRIIRGLLAIVVCAPAASLAAQDAGSGSALAIRALRRDAIVAAATVTAAFTVTNRRDAAVLVVPRVGVPAHWTLLTGRAPFTLARGGSEVLIFSAAVPARAPAGTYVLRTWVRSPADSAEVVDSVVVVVPQRHKLDVGLIDRPAFVVAGKPYDARFLVRNRGNVAVTVRVSARSTLGSPILTDTILALAAEESRVVAPRVLTPGALDAATDDVLEVQARATSDTGVLSHASARVTVVPEPDRRIEEYVRIPTQLRVRAASSDGVSPFELFGGGILRDGGSTRLNFLMRGPTGAYSAFGERDEYSMDLLGSSWRIRAGDHLYMLSSLTGTGQPGFGGSLDGSLGMLSAGAYAQQFRRLVEKGSESGAYVSARPTSQSRVAFNVVNRLGGVSPGGVGSASAALQRDGYGGEVEVARSRTTVGVSGLARSARVGADVARGAFEIGHVYADTGFTGTQRGSRHDYLTAHQQATDNLSLALSASTHRTDLSRSTGVPYVENFDVATLGATLFNRYTAEVGAVARATTVQGVRGDADQRSLRVRGDHPLRFGTLTLEIEGGRAREAGASTDPRAYAELSLGLRRMFARGAGALWVDRYSGGSITKGTEGTFTIGGDMSAPVGRATNVMLVGYTTRVRTTLPEWHSQLDGQVVHQLRNGSTISLRARLMTGGTVSTSDASVVYLEYGMPFRVPVARLRTPGRVRGRVIDAASGNGVAGALVRLGPQVAITDARGQVAFGGVPAGAHRVSLSQETSFADAVFVGDPTLRIDSTRGQPTIFELAIARSARVDVAVRRVVAARTAIAGVADSLVDAGALANATLVLVGGRDTLYRTTGQDGFTSFTDVPPGTWVISVHGDPPAFTRFDPDRVELTLAPGERRALRFQLVPRKREVQIIGAGEELTPMTPQPKKGGPPATPVRPVKPPR